MRRVIIALTIFGLVGLSLAIGLLAVKASGEFLSVGATFFGEAGSGRFSPSVAGMFSEQSGEPVLSESRTVSSDFTPIRKADTYNLSVPNAHAAILMDAATGKILYERNADEERQIASLTKLFTTMIVIEQVKNLDEAVTIDEESVYTEGTRVGCPRSGYCIGERLHIGEQISVRSLLHAALMNSANDSALALAKHIDGSKEKFVDRMNARAKAMGLEHTHFCTPSGLEIDGHEQECYSSARDVATIASFALRYKILWDIMRSEKMVISSIDGKYHHDIFNTDELLGAYPNLIGTKTGFTPNAGKSLLAVAADPSGNHELVAVVLDDVTRWQSVPSMLRWGFESFEWK